MKLTETCLEIEVKDLQGREQVWIDFGLELGRVHICVHKNSSRVVAWLRKTVGKMTKATYPY